MKIDEKVLGVIRQIDWFHNCGNALKNDIIFSCSYVENWNEAQLNYHSSIWENTTLEARNALTVFLHDKHRDQYLNWNHLAKEARGFLEEEIVPKIELYKEKNNLDNVFIDSVKWDVLNAIMEKSYKKHRNSPVFFSELLTVYESGNFPCGWDGEWPKGKLVIY